MADLDLVLGMSDQVVRENLKSLAAEASRIERMAGGTASGHADGIAGQFERRLLGTTKVANAAVVGITASAHIAKKLLDDYATKNREFSETWDRLKHSADGMTDSIGRSISLIFQTGGVVPLIGQLDKFINKVRDTLDDVVRLTSLAMYPVAGNGRSFEEYASDVEGSLSAKAADDAASKAFGDQLKSRVDKARYEMEYFIAAGDQVGAALSRRDYLKAQADLDVYSKYAKDPVSAERVRTLARLEGNRVVREAENAALERQDRRIKEQQNAYENYLQNLIEQRRRASEIQESVIRRGQDQQVQALRMAGYERESAILEAQLDTRREISRIEDEEALGYEERVAIEKQLSDQLAEQVDSINSFYDKKDSKTDRLGGFSLSAGVSSAPGLVGANVATQATTVSIQRNIDRNLAGVRQDLRQLIEAVRAGQVGHFAP